ncbi:MAG TPA: (Fe-S)-binding protein [Candidatus Lustribacter sp.]|nr:(Fe-S)-binding protein [Candidatus Lustribacter sp.]
MSAAGAGPSGVSEPSYRRGIFDEKLLAACISCGFCLPACPTYAETKLENSSPRGRITLMRALEEGRLDEDDPTLQHQAGLCLGCRACETVCPAGVRYGELLEQWRDHQWRGRHTPPVAAALRAAVRVTPALAAGGLARGAARTTGAADRARPHLMLGCMERSLFPKVSRAAARLVPEADVPSGQGCCGALHAHNGGSVEAAQMAARLGERMPGVIVTTSGGCAAYLAHQLGHDRVKEVSEFLVERWARDPASMPVLRRLTVDGRPARVGLKDSCQLRNGLGVTAQPRALIGRVAEYVELASAGVCCGGAGTYSILQPKMSQQVLDPTLQQARDAELDYLVALNIVCQRQLQTGVRKARLKVKVVHLVELLEMALE